MIQGYVSERYGRGRDDDGGIARNLRAPRFARLTKTVIQRSDSF